MDNKKELREAYKTRRPPMGVLAIFAPDKSRFWLIAAADLQAEENSARFKLGLGSFAACRELQSAWNAAKGEGFTFETVEALPYDQDPSKTDYKADLALLRDLTREKLVAEGKTEYKR